MFEPYARDLAQRVPSAARRILEVAAGTGRVTRHLLRGLAADGQLIATDLTEAMVVEGKQLSPNDPRLTWQIADAQALPFPDGSVDVVVCQFGLMFVPDKALAMREMRRVLAPGGILLLSTWDELAKNHASAMFHEMIFATLPEEPPLFINTPFSLHDPHELERLATEAGLRGIRVDTVAQVGEAESAQHLVRGYIFGSLLSTHLADRGVDRELLEAKVAERLASRLGDRPLQTPLSAHVLTAFA